jgi:hypothetical protein
MSSPSISDTCANYSRTVLNVEPGAKCCVSLSGLMACSLALFIIGCIGAAGAFPGPTMGWVTVGLAGGGFVLQFVPGNLKQRKVDLICGSLGWVAAIAIGTLGGLGILSATQVGWSILGIIAGNLVIGACVLPIFKRDQLRQANALGAQWGQQLGERLQQI